MENDPSVHEMIWGYAGALSVLGGLFVYAVKKQWPQRIWAIIYKVLVFLHIIKPPEPPMDAHMRIKKMLIELRTETRADRAHIVQLHNGDYYDNNSSIKRFTYCYEDIKDGVTTVADKYQRCLVSSYIDGLKILLDSQAPVNKLEYNDLDSCLYKSKMIEDGVHLQVGIPLRCKFNGIPRIIGYMLLSYDTERSPEKCSFSALTEEGHFMDTDTGLVPKICNGTCAKCRFNKYIPQFEQALKDIK